MSGGHGWSWARRLADQPGGLAESHEFITEGRPWRVQCVTAGLQHQPEVGPQAGSIQAGYFAQAALDAIAVDGVAEFFFAGYGGHALAVLAARVLRLIGDHAHKGAMLPAAGGKDAQEITAAPQQGVARQTQVGWCQIWPAHGAGIVQMLTRLRPLARRALKTARPPRVLMRSRKPCVRLRQRFEG